MAYVLGEPTVQQYFDSNGDPLASGSIEFYLAGTSTPTAIYSDSTGTSLGTSVTLNSTGSPESSGGTPVALFFDTTINYKIVLKNSAGTAISPTIDPYTVAGGVAAAYSGKNYATLALAVAATDIQDGDVLNIAERTTGNGGGGFWDVVLSSTVTENTYNIVQCTGVATLSLALRWKNRIITPAQWGAAGDGVTDDSSVFQALALLGLTVYLDAGSTYLINSNLPCITGSSFVSSRSGATIKSTSASSLNIFTGTSTADNAFKNIIFDMPVCSASLDITPIKFTDSTGLSVHKCFMDDGYTLVNIFGATDLHITECKSNTPYSYGVLLAGDIT
jgi:hypothetical protein